MRAGGTAEPEGSGRRRGLILGLVWGAFALVLAGIGALMLHSCGLHLFGSTIFDFCPAAAEAPEDPPNDLLVLVAERDSLEDRVHRLRLEVALVDDCPVPAPQVAEKEPEPEPEPEPEVAENEPEPEPEPEPEEICRTQPPEDRKVDLYLLLDASGSFQDDLPAIRATLQDLIRRAAAGKLQGQVRLGLGSFIDKPIGPYPSLYTYKHHQGLTTDFGKVLAALRTIDITENYDEPEAQLEAMLEAAGRVGQIGYTDDAQRIMVVITDEDYHRAGDYPAPPEDGKADGNALNEDYPSVGQVRRALEAAGITPLFLVTDGAASHYRNLVSQLGRGTVARITESSDNLLQALSQGVEEICGDGLAQ
jgi:hypothetical protein